jgi:hypothetical protein
LEGRDRIATLALEGLHLDISLFEALWGRPAEGGVHGHQKIMGKSQVGPIRLRTFGGLLAALRFQPFTHGMAGQLFRVSCPSVYLFFAAGCQGQNSQGRTQFGHHSHREKFRRTRRIGCQFALAKTKIAL